MSDFATQFLTARELAERHRKSEQTLHNERSAGTGVPYTKIGGKVVYALADVLRYEEEGERGYSKAVVAAAVKSFPGLAADAQAKLLKHIDRTVKYGG